MFYAECLGSPLSGHRLVEAPLGTFVLIPGQCRSGAKQFMYGVTKFVLAAVCCLCADRCRGVVPGGLPAVLPAQAEV